MSAPVGAPSLTAATYALFLGDLKSEFFSKLIEKLGGVQVDAVGRAIADYPHDWSVRWQAALDVEENLEEVAKIETYHPVVVFPAGSLLSLGGKCGDEFADPLVKGGNDVEFCQGPFGISALRLLRRCDHHAATYRVAHLGPGTGPF